MNKTLFFDFTVDKVNNTINIKREFAGNRAFVWDCYTKSEILDQWWMPHPWKSRTKSMDFREGGHWQYAMVEPNGQRHLGRMDYLTIQPIDGYTSLDGFCDDTGALNPALPRSTWDVTFIDLGKHTVVETVVSYPSAEALEQVIQMGLEEGLTSTLERLDELLLTLN